MIILSPDEATNRHRLEKAAREAAREAADLAETHSCHDMIEAEIVEPATCGGNPDILPNVPLAEDLLFQSRGDGLKAKTDILPNVALSDSPLFQSRVDNNLKAKTDLPNPKDLIGATKPPLDLVPSALTIHVAGVMALGARKYGKFNWRQHKVKYSIYLAAALRHLAQAADGEDIDPESGQPHLAHAAACCGIVLDAVACNMVIDDRGAPGPASKLLKEHTQTK